MPQRRSWVLLAALAGFLLAGCGKSGPAQIPTEPAAPINSKTDIVPMNFGPKKAK